MYQDAVIKDVWKNREAYAKRFHHNLHEIVVDIQKRQQKPLSRIVDKRREVRGAMACCEDQRIGGEMKDCHEKCQEGLVKC